MRTETIQIYKFSELSAEAQEYALDHNRDFYTDGEWWDFVYEDAKTIGL
jgi:hypothetical protein